MGIAVEEKKEFHLEYQEISEGVEDILTYTDWVKTKAELKFLEPKAHNFKILFNALYWAHLGCNIGSEEGKHRPVIITRTYGKSPMCTIIPLTSERLGDGYWYHIDLENRDSTALVEQMRTIDLRRIDKPIYKCGKIETITIKDANKISAQVEFLYSIKIPKNIGKI